MSALDELFEFIDTAGTDMPAPKAGKNKSPTPYPDDPSDWEFAGGFAQYTQVGPGLMPVPSTIQKLPPAMYKIQYTNQGPVFVRMFPATDQLLRLPDSKSDEVIRDIERFWGMKETFKSLGYSHKRGFLLWGPQGSGKTSTINTVSQQIIANKGVAFFVSDVDPGDVATMLGRFREAEPDRPAVVLLEDIDTIIQQFGEHNVLSLLDGENSIANVVFIATTNYPEKLDPRVINRPSRFDKIVKIGMPTPEARRMYIESRKLELSPEELEQWVDLTEDFSIAHIKELIVSVKCFGCSLDESVERLRAMERTPKSDSSDTKVGFGFGG